MSELRLVSWKLHSWKGVWTPTHLTANGKTTLCAHKIPKVAWCMNWDADEPRKRWCKNCKNLEGRR